MTRSNSQKLKQPSLNLIAALFLFAAAALLTLKTTSYATTHFLDGDASSELVLAEHLAQTGRILSSDWIYSTELRVLNTQLVYAPLFKLFSDWQTVRFAAALIMQAMLVFSYGFLCFEASLSLSAFFFGAALLLLPTSIAYGRIVLYHCYYIPHIIISFLFVGLFLAAIRNLETKRPLRSTADILLFFLLSFLSGLGGIRQVIITQLPLLILIIYFIFADAADQAFFPTVKKHISKLLLALAGIAAFLPGYIINSTVFQEMYSFSDYGNITLNLAPVSNLRSILLGYLELFCFHNNTPVFSLSGILSLCGLFAAFYLIYHCLTLFRLNTASMPYVSRITSYFLASALFVILCVFLLSDGAWYYSLYFIPVVIWYVPSLSVQYANLPERPLQLKRQDICTLATITVILFNTAVNTVWFNGHMDHFKRPYSGLSYQNPTLATELKNPIAVLCENGFTHGYATFWQSNVVTELTDGKIRMTSIHAHGDSGIFTPLSWLTLRSSLQPQEGKTFLLLRAAEDNHFVMRNHTHKGTRIYENDGYFVIYAFENEEDLLSAISE